MLVLGRKLGEPILIDGRILVRVVQIRGKVVAIGIDAPPDVSIRRAELPGPTRDRPVPADTRKRRPKNAPLSSCP
jgi:carbon storage regulator